MMKIKASIHRLRPADVRGLPLLAVADEAAVIGRSIMA